MKNNLVLMTLALILLAGCGEEEGKLTIDDARAAGFEEDRQQRFDLIDAEDGWSGFWSEDRVEIYQYPRSDKVKLDFFEGIIEIGEEENHGWVEFCQQKNLIMLAKGRTACTRLATVTPGHRAPETDN